MANGLAACMPQIRSKGSSDTGPWRGKEGRYSGIFPFPGRVRDLPCYNQLHDAGWNHCLTVGLPERVDPIRSDPRCKAILRQSKKRGVLTVEEAQRLFELPWDDERSKTGNMLLIV